MNLLQLAERAKEVITGRGKWTTNYRDDGEGAHCALGAIEEALSLPHNESECPTRGAEGHRLGRGLIVRMAALLGVESNISECAGAVMKYNDDGTQRKVQGLYQRVINQLREEYQERRMKRTVKGLLKNASIITEAPAEELVD